MLAESPGKCCRGEHYVCSDDGYPVLPGVAFGSYLEEFPGLSLHEPTLKRQPPAPGRIPPGINCTVSCQMLCFRRRMPLRAIRPRMRNDLQISVENASTKAPTDSASSTGSVFRWNAAHPASANSSSNQPGITEHSSTRSTSVLGVSGGILQGSWNTLEMMRCVPWPPSDNCAKSSTTRSAAGSPVKVRQTYMSANLGSSTLAALYPNSYADGMAIIAVR